ncbi:hypothetical protein [Rhodococcus qingshengii]|uniref:hypothetical protein n=1 Tax=Rhodococcus qingshengii TaxID=334542 RepID=UPI002AFE4A95|nr:hypothetical protein [Rhodococcus qingshengii]MEA1798561.1 hypothetical protein [Rhodococcus qingshengii]
MSTFTVDGLDGIEFTAEFDTAENWLTISGHDRDGDLVSKTGLSVTPDPIENIALTPEVVVDDASTSAAAAYSTQFATYDTGGLR